MWQFVSGHSGSCLQDEFPVAIVPVESLIIPVSSVSSPVIGVRLLKIATAGLVEKSTFTLLTDVWAEGRLHPQEFRRAFKLISKC